jgi:hypothetical protein
MAKGCRIDTESCKEVLPKNPPANDVCELISRVSREWSLKPIIIYPRPPGVAIGLASYWD